MRKSFAKDSKLNAIQNHFISQEIKSFCLKEGFDEKIFKRLSKLYANDRSAATLAAEICSTGKEFALNEGLTYNAYNLIVTELMDKKTSVAELEKIIKEYSNLFDSLGFGPDDTLSYLNTNFELFTNTSKIIKSNIVILDYAGVLEDALFNNPQLISRRRNSGMLYSVIKYLKSSADINKEGLVKLTSAEIDYYLNSLSSTDKATLEKEYPLTEKKLAFLSARHDTLTQTRLKENKSYIMKQAEII